MGTSDGVTFDGLGAAALAARLRAPRCVVLRSVSSTLDLVHELAGEDAPAGTVVLAEEQVAGRGRLGRRWQSPVGQGIWLGYLSRPEHGLRLNLASLRVGLSVVTALRELEVPVELKWPNDLVLDGRKLGGILCETRWKGESVRWMAIGIGINARAPLPVGLTDMAVTLDDAVPGISRVAVLERVVPRLHALPVEPDLSEEERALFAAHDWLKGRELAAPVAGRAEGISKDGALLVATSTGTERVVGGSIVTA